MSTITTTTRKTTGTTNTKSENKGHRLVPVPADRAISSLSTKRHREVRVIAEAMIERRQVQHEEERGVCACPSRRGGIERECNRGDCGVVSDAKVQKPDSGIEGRREQDEGGGVLRNLLSDGEDGRLDIKC